MKLWYTSPANYWEEALPLGNGRLGAMVWSGVQEEKISLNEDSLWSGYPNSHNIPGAAEHYPVARQMVMEGKYSQAQAYIEEHVLGQYTQSYLPMGELILTMEQHAGKVENYCRSLELDRALSTMKYTVGGINYTRETFVSYPDQALVMCIQADKPGAVSFLAGYTCQLRSEVSAQGDCLLLKGIAPSQVDPSYVESANPVIYEEAPEKKGMQFMAAAQFELTGGSLEALENGIRVQGADSVVIRLCAQTGFNGPFHQPFTDGKDFEKLCRQDLTQAKKLDYQTLLDRHVQDYKSYFDRVTLDLGKGDDERPIPERLADWDKEGDPGRYALLFQYGRYLIISASRPGTQPTNLQGIWNQHLRAPWSSNYTININTEMNYWPVEAVGLPEFHQPLFDLLNTLRITGAETAKVHYNAGGFVSHHNSDIWGLSNPVGDSGKGTAVYAFWPMSSGWLSSHAFEHYLFTKDTKFLRETGYPIIKDAARFYLDILTEDEDGTLIFAPSTSPENCFLTEGEKCGVAKTTTMTTAIIRETLINAIASAALLGVDEAFRLEAEAALKRMPEYKIGSRGQLLEWHTELEESEPNHRHTSHLYPLYPGHEITLEGTPDLAKACKQTLDLRGDESTGWALAWRINLFARLGESERAFSILQKQMRPVSSENIMNYAAGGGCYPNLFGAHPPFQIDSNYGVCAGIAELLLQSSQEEVLLLPALPKAFSDGSVTGLRARGGLSVDIKFQSGKLTEAVLKSLTGEKHDTTVCYEDKKCRVTVVPGEACTLSLQDF